MAEDPHRALRTSDIVERVLEVLDWRDLVAAQGTCCLWREVVVARRLWRRLCNRIGKGKDLLSDLSDHCSI